jgi:hypothetical protein
MSSNYKTITFTADTIDGQILEFPEKFDLRCSLIQLIGAQTVRNYTGTECIEAMNVFVIYYCGQLLGSKCWKDSRSFFKWMKSRCENAGFRNVCIDTKPLLINGCVMQL